MPKINQREAAQQYAGCPRINPDHVDAQPKTRGPNTFLVLSMGTPGQADHAIGFLAVDVRFRACNPSGPVRTQAGLDLYNHQRRAFRVDTHQVDLALGKRDVLGQHPVPEPAQVPRGGTLPEATEASVVRPTASIAGD